MEPNAGLSTAMSQVKLQNDVAARVLELAQGQDQATADLLDATLENLQEILATMADGLGENFDASA